MSDSASVTDLDVGELLVSNNVLYKIVSVSEHERGGFRVSASTIPYVPTIPPGTPPPVATELVNRAKRRRVANFRFTESDTLVWVYDESGRRALKRESHLPPIEERRKQAWAELRSQVMQRPPTPHNCTVCGVMHTRDGRIFDGTNSPITASSE